MPTSLWLAGLCEAFPGRFPSEVLDEIDRLPAGMLDEVVEARHYRRAKAMVDAATTEADRKQLPESFFVEMADLFDFEDAKAAMNG